MSMKFNQKYLPARHSLKKKQKTANKQDQMG